MLKIETIKDIYPAIDELISVLAKKDSKQQELANILKNRMYESCWTTGSELLRELKYVIKNFIKKKKVEDTLNKQMVKIIDVINDWENNREIRWIRPLPKDNK